MTEKILTRTQHKHINLSFYSTKANSEDPGQVEAHIQSCRVLNTGYERVNEIDINTCTDRIRKAPKYNLHPSIAQILNLRHLVSMEGKWKFYSGAL